MLKKDSIPIPINTTVMFLFIMEVIFTSCFCCVKSYKIKDVVLGEEYDIQIDAPGDIDSDDSDIESVSMRNGPQHIREVVPWDNVVQDYLDTR